MIKNTFIKLYNYFCFFASLCFNIIFVEYISVCLQKQLPQVLCKKKVILKNFANFTEKHLCWSLFLVELQPWRSTTLLKKRLHCSCFPENIANFLRTAFCLEHLQWLLLKLDEEFLRDSWERFAQTFSDWGYEIT